MFFRAMQDGYANPNVQKGTIIELPGSKTITFVLGDFKVVDCYFTNSHGNHSAGSTHIWCEGQLVWTMSYQGWYQEEVVPFLKKALRQNYDIGFWNGGRGPSFFADDGMTYFNNVNSPNEWKHFHGKEMVYDRNGQLAGFHEYQGVLLVLR